MRNSIVVLLISIFPILLTAREKVKDISVDNTKTIHEKDGVKVYIRYDFEKDSEDLFIQCNLEVFEKLKTKKDEDSKFISDSFVAFADKKLQEFGKTDDTTVTFAFYDRKTDGFLADDKDDDLDELSVIITGKEYVIDKKIDLQPYQDVDANMQKYKEKYRLQYMMIKSYFDNRNPDKQRRR